MAAKRRLTVLSNDAEAPEPRTLFRDVQWTGLTLALIFALWIPSAALAAAFTRPRIASLGTAPSFLEIAAQLLAITISGAFGGYVAGRYREERMTTRERARLAAIAGALAALLPSSLVAATALRAGFSSSALVAVVVVLVVPPGLLGAITAGGALWGVRKRSPAPPPP